MRIRLRQPVCRVNGVQHSIKVPVWMHVHDPLRLLHKKGLTMCLLIWCRNETTCVRGQRASTFRIHRGEWGCNWEIWRREHWQPGFSTTLGDHVEVRRDGRVWKASCLDALLLGRSQA